MIEVLQTCSNLHLSTIVFLVNIVQYLCVQFMFSGRTLAPVLWIEHFSRGHILDCYWCTSLLGKHTTSICKCCTTYFAVLSDWVLVARKMKSSRFWGSTQNNYVIFAYTTFLSMIFFVPNMKIWIKYHFGRLDI